MVTKMTAVSKITLLLLCCSIISSKDPKASADDCNNYTTVGEDFIVPLNLQIQQVKKLRWKHNSNVIFEWKSTKNDETGIKSEEKIICQNGSLRLTNLEKTHSGLYLPEVYDSDGVSKAINGIRLCVLDRIPKPQLKHKCVQNKDQFTCMVEKVTDKLRFEWLQDNKVLEKQTEKTLKLEPKKVEVKSSYICKVYNDAGTFMTSDSVPSGCTKPGLEFPQEVLGVSIWIFVGCGGGVVLVLIVVIIVCCVKAKHKKRAQLKDEEELRLGWTNPQQQQQNNGHQHNHPPHNHHHQQQQPAGHTGPRQHRPKQQRPRAPDPNNSHPEPSPRRSAQAPRPVVDDDEQPPPLPQPRKKTPKTQRM